VVIIRIMRKTAIPLLKNFSLCLAQNKRKPYFWWISFAVVVMAVFLLSISRPIFQDPFSTVVFDRNGKLLGARIATDGQWRFEERRVVPEKFRQCLIAFEDRYFFSHPGVNLFSIIRAAYRNLKAGKIVSGGSTITMQTIRLSRKGKPRNIPEKLIEMWLALRLETLFTKSEILALYASHAPFGGNVVGLDAAAWRYYGRSPENLSWAEAATLAVLPNAPALIHPGRNRDALKMKRNRLLDHLLQSATIDSLTCWLSKDESLPEKPVPLPGNALHVVNRMEKVQPGRIVHTTIDLELQDKVKKIAERHQLLLSANEIHNAAILVIDVKANEVVAYIGNTMGKGKRIHHNEVDVIVSPRSSGSVLKPLLYASMLDAGEVLPTTLVADIPTTISNFSPRNFNVEYDGAVPAREALIRSLNVPAVRLLSDFGLERFYIKLQDCGFSTIGYPADHYGLSLILGGAEITLWDLCKVYRGFANTLTHYDESGGNYPDCPFQEPVLEINESPESCDKRVVFGAGSIYNTIDAMKDVHRPEAEAGWESFFSSHPIAWKTGTSYGFRDAWAVGLTPEYAVGVWVGNADGEGRPGLTGLSAAAPILFAVFDLLPTGGWFEPPWDELMQIAVCRQSGMRPSQYCPDTDTVWVSQSGLESEVCPYHKLIHLDATEKFRVHAGCYPADQIKTKSQFVLPPVMAWYYRSKNPFYKDLPPWMAECNDREEKTMQLIWPDKPTRIFVPREFDGRLGEVVFEVAHDHPEKIVFWYVDEEYLGQTQYQHRMGMQPSDGKHQLILVDGDGNFLMRKFEVVGKK